LCLSLGATALATEKVYAGHDVLSQSVICQHGVLSHLSAVRLFSVELSELSKRGQWSHALKNALFALVSQHKTTSSAMGRGNSYERRKLAAYNDE
jgi:hypothetical protein